MVRCLHDHEKYAIFALRKRNRSSMDRTKLRGVGVALVTPFRENGDIDFSALERIVDRTIANGADYLVALGTTAETPTLTCQERNDVRKCVAACASGRVPLVVGCGGNNTLEVCRELSSTDFSGYDAVLSVAPFYNKPSQRGLSAHFSAVASSSPLDIVLYNIPGRTGVNMLPDTTLELAAAHSNIIGVKEASGIMGQFNRLICESSEDFAVISGDDALALPVSVIGGAGVISVLANAFPAHYCRMVHEALDGDVRSAAALHREFVQLYSLLFVDGNPAGIKALLAALGVCGQTMRLPLVPVSDGVGAKIERQASRLSARGFC